VLCDRVRPGYIELRDHHPGSFLFRRGLWCGVAQRYAGLFWTCASLLLHRCVMSHSTTENTTRSGQDCVVVDTTRGTVRHGTGDPTPTSSHIFPMRKKKGDGCGMVRYLFSREKAATLGRSFSSRPCVGCLSPTPHWYTPVTTTFTQGFVSGLSVYD